jgi:hypothetical protein
MSGMERHPAAGSGTEIAAEIAADMTDPTGLQTTREMRFGVRLDERHSQYWKVRADVGRPDFYVASQRTGRFLHVSLHDPDYGMHVKVRAPEGLDQRVKPYPRRLVPGVVRLVQLRVPQAAVSYPVPARSVTWIDRPDDEALWVSFEILAEEPGAWRDEGSWNRGCTLVGRVPRSDGGTVAVAAWLMTGRDGTTSFDAGSIEAADAARAMIAKGGVRALIHGPNPDGSMWFLELTTAIATPNATEVPAESALG